MYIIVYVPRLRRAVGLLPSPGDCAVHVYATIVGSAYTTCKQLLDQGNFSGHENDIHFAWLVFPRQKVFRPYLPFLDLKWTITNMTVTFVYFF